MSRPSAAWAAAVLAVLAASPSGAAPLVGPPRAVDDPVAALLGRESWPALAHLGAGYLVVWADFRAGTSRRYRARLDKTGRASEPRGFLVGEDVRLPPVLASGGDIALAVWRTGGTPHCR
jgi:hypothetical protein